VNSTSPLIRVLGPIKVVDTRVLSLFLFEHLRHPFRRIPACLGFHRHSLRLPNEGLTETVAQVSVFAAANFDPDARRLEPLRQLYGFVIILKVTEGVCQADAPVRRTWPNSSLKACPASSPSTVDRGAAGHHGVRLSGLHQHEFEAELTWNGLRHRFCICWTFT